MTSSITHTNLYKSICRSTRSYHLPKHLILATSLLVSIPSMAIETPDVDENDLPLAKVTLPAITVTATRTPTQISNTIAQTRVVGAEELRQFTGATALEVIKRQPGFSYYNNGGIGSNSNFYLRGYDNKQILVLIDGVRYESISTGGTALNLLPAEQIDRIEILYGASGSSIYGANAMGGVIQVFTKGQDSDQSQFSITAGAGSNDHYLYGAIAQFVNDKGTRLNLSANRNQTKGFNATIANPANTSDPYHPDDDGFESNNYSASLSQNINDNLMVGISGLYSDSMTEFDNGTYTNAHSDQKNGAVQGYVDWRYAPSSSAKLSYGESIDESITHNKYPSEFKTRQKQVALTGYHALPTGRAVYGAEHIKQSLDSTAYDADDRKVTSGFLGYMLTQGALDAQLNVRYDDYSDFDSETTYNAGVAYQMTPDLRVGVNYAKGFSAPSFNSMYYPGSGNPNLNPETSDNYEAFIEYDTVAQSTRITGYKNKVEDLIAYKSAPTATDPWAGSMFNVNKADIQGVTLTSDWYLDDYLFGLSYDYQEATDASGGSDDGNDLPIRPKNKGLVYVGYQLPNLDLRAEYQYTDSYYSNVENMDNQKVDSYGLFNISGNYRLTPNLSMSARLNNVFNKKYVTLPNYKTDGANFMSAVTYTW